MLVEKHTIWGKDYLKEQSQDGLRSHVCNHLLRAEAPQRGLEKPRAAALHASDRMGRLQSCRSLLVLCIEHVIDDRAPHHKEASSY